jgi:hypothetical protein
VEEYYEVKGEKAVLLHYNTITDQLCVYMADQYCFKFHEVHIVDYNNDALLVLSNFKSLHCENFVVNKKELESWRKCLASFGSSMIVVLK